VSYAKIGAPGVARIFRSCHARRHGHLTTRRANCAADEQEAAMPMPRRSKSIRIAVQASELAVAAPQVIAQRTARAALAGGSPSARDRREFQRMGAEKVAAFYESWTAMLIEISRANLRLVLAPAVWLLQWTPTRRRSRVASSHAQRTALAVLGSGIAPIHRRVVANARRLQRPVRARKSR
jgi:hypothetical protein